MNSIERRPEVQVARLGDSVAVSGDLEQIDAALAAGRRSGRIVGSASKPVPTGVPGQFVVTVRAAPVVRYAPAAAPARAAVPWRWWLAGGAAVLGALCAVGWLISVAVSWVLANLAPIIGVLVLLALVGGRFGGGRLVEVFVRVRG